MRLPTVNLQNHHFPEAILSKPTEMLPQGVIVPWDIMESNNQLCSENSEEDDLDYLAANMELDNYPHNSSSQKLKRKRSSRDTSIRSLEGAGVLPPAGETEWDPSKQLFHTGKWPIEEERYANKLVLEFEAGMLDDCRDGVTLRSYLAKTLRCAPMRVSKKLAGKCIGSKVFCRQQGDRKKFLEEIAAGELNVTYLQKRMKQKKCATERTPIKFMRPRSSSDLTDDESTSGLSSGSDDREDCDSDNSRPEEELLNERTCMSTEDMGLTHPLRSLQESTATEDIFACPLLADFDNTIEYGSYYHPTSMSDTTVQSVLHVMDVGYDEWRDALSYFQENDCVLTPSNGL